MNVCDSASPIVGYLVSEYPAKSHTFIRREIEALRASGICIKTYSVRVPPAEDLDGEGARAASETFHILAVPVVHMVIGILSALAKSPLRFLSTYVLAMKHRVPGLRALLWAHFHFVEAVILSERLRLDQVGRLHSHFANAGATVGLLASHFNSIPWSFTIHGISEFDYPAGNLLPEKLLHAEFSACASYFGMAQAMRLSAPALWPKLHVVRCALDPRELPERSKGESNGLLQIVCVGRLSPEKGHLGLLRTFEGLLNRGVSARLKLVGDGPLRSLLEAEAERMGIENFIVFFGALDEAATLREIARSDILVLPSFMEGLPIVLMEGMALGVSVISSQVAGVPELVRNEDNGLLVAPADWEGLEQAMWRLASMPSLRKRLAESAYERVSDSFFYPAAASPLGDLLRGKARFD